MKPDVTSRGLRLNRFRKEEPNRKWEKWGGRGEVISVKNVLAYKVLSRIALEGCLAE